MITVVGILLILLIAGIVLGSSGSVASSGALLVGNKIIDGNMPFAGTAIIYTAPSNINSATILSVSLVNTTSGAITVNLYVNNTGTDRRVIDKDLSLAASGSAGNRFAELIGISLLQGGLLKADASATGVDYVIQLLEIPAAT